MFKCLVKPGSTRHPEVERGKYTKGEGAKDEKGRKRRSQIHVTMAKMEKVFERKRNN